MVVLYFLDHLLARRDARRLRNTRDSYYVMEKPSRCWLGAVPRYWKVVASCFQFTCFAENTSAPLAPSDSTTSIKVNLLCLDPVFIYIR